MKVFRASSATVLATPEEEVNLGDIFVHRQEASTVLLKVTGFDYVSNISDPLLAEISTQPVSAEPFRLGYYGSPITLVARLKPLAKVQNRRIQTVRSPIPPGSVIHPANQTDLEFLVNQNGVYFGNVRSADRDLGIPVRLDSRKVITTHVLIAATTGRGKSNLIKVMLSSLLDNTSVGVLVMDAHKEYHEALCGHKNAERYLVSYSPFPKSGELQLAVSTRLIRPEHVKGAIGLSEAQEREAYLLSSSPRNSGSTEDETERCYGNDWVEALINEEAVYSTQNPNARTSRATLSRKLRRLLQIDSKGSIFRLPSKVPVTGVDGSGFLSQIRTHLEGKKIVLIDTSLLGSDAEILLGNIITDTLLDWRIAEKRAGYDPEPIAVVLEEAPRVLSRESAPNSYTRVAREGRKFGIGLIAVTQLMSVIPEEILANMNTKVYMGMASENERRAAIQNALNDMTGEDEELLKLDTGDGILTSTSLGFAIPIHVPPVSTRAERASASGITTGRKLIED